MQHGGQMGCSRPDAPWVAKTGIVGLLHESLGLWNEFGAFSFASNLMLLRAATCAATDGRIVSRQRSNPTGRGFKLNVFTPYLKPNSLDQMRREGTRE